jgi:SAM-dependent methyltransferase
MTSALPCPTFRDPAGSLCFENDQVIRRIAPSARDAVLDLLEAPFCQRLQQRGDLIAATAQETRSGLSLIHPKIPIPTYPWEWTAAQWIAAAELTLDVCEAALAEGWILKDATPLNVLFEGSRPVFVDFISFERRNPNSSIWLAYGQYVRTFLLPLLMNRLLHWPLALSLMKRDGYEPADCYAALGWAHRLGRQALWPITLPALLDRRKATGTGVEKNRPASNADPEVTLSVLRRTLKNLRRRTVGAVAAMPSSEWSDYTQTLAHYTPEQSERKKAWVRQAIAAAKPERVLDIGANTGEYSAVAAESGVPVVALERDPAAAERIFRMAQELNLNIQTIQADIARPTPAAGWENTESTALLSRLEDQFDMVLMLAVIHHLVLMEQIPLARIVALCHRLTRRHLIVEWVPVEDPMYQSLMRGRASLYGWLKEGDLLAACEGSFAVIDRERLDNGRVLLLLEKIKHNGIAGAE